MTPAPISVVRALLDKATALPWEADAGTVRPAPESPDRVTIAYCSGEGSPQGEADAELIAAAVNALPALMHQLAEHEKETDRLHALINAGNRRIAELEAAYLHYRPLAERAEAAERAREEFRLLASLRLFHAPTIGYCWFERSGVSWTGKAHATINEANAEKTAAFLAASGGKDNG